MMEITKIICRFYTWFFLVLCFFLAVLYFTFGDIMIFIASILCLVMSCFMRTWELQHRILDIQNEGVRKYE